MERLGHDLATEMWCQTDNAMELQAAPAPPRRSTVAQGASQDPNPSLHWSQPPPLPLSLPPPERRRRSHQMQGSASSQVPMGLSSRISCAYGTRRGGSAAISRLDPPEVGGAASMAASTSASVIRR
mgnify:CR=1 FL=1